MSPFLTEEEAMRKVHINNTMLKKMKEESESSKFRNGGTTADANIASYQFDSDYDYRRLDHHIPHIIESHEVNCMPVLVSTQASFSLPDSILNSRIELGAYLSFSLLGISLVLAGLLIYAAVCRTRAR